MTTEHLRLSTIFAGALEVSRDDRARYLDDACGGDDSLRREVESLLEAHDSAGPYFDELSQRIVAPALGDLGVATAPIDLLSALQSSLAQSYRIERELTGGGMSRVFLAEEIALRRRVVIKTLAPEMAAAVNVDRFRSEIAVIARLQHPHIIPLFTANATGRFLYYTMPFVAGESLRDRLATAGALAVDDALRIWRDILDALGHAHAGGIVHRDIKPANILLSGRNALVADFGIARAIEASVSEARAGVTGPIGTPAYMAPEQASGGKIDQRADIYAAGLVMYEMLAGHGPFAAASAREYVDAHVHRDPPAEPLRRPDVPAPLAALVVRCLTKEPASRPESADAVLAELDRMSQQGLPSATTLRRPRPLAAVGSLALVVIGAWGMWRATTSAPPIPNVARHTSPDTAVRLYQRGLAEQRRRTLEGAVEAMALFERAIAIDSEFSLAWAATARTAQFANNRGWSFPGRSSDSLLSLAVRTSRRAVALDSGLAEAWTVAGKVAGAVDLEDRAATLHALRRALSLDSTYAETWLELGLAYEESLRPRDAERAWLRAAELSPTDVQVLAFLGLHYLWYDDFATGARWADSAIALDPTYVLARDAAAYLALAMRRPEITVRHAETLVRARGIEAHLPLCLLATAAAGRGELARARQYVLDAEKVVAGPAPSKHESVHLAAAWAAVGDTARAIRWLAAYPPQRDLHFQLHVKRDPGLRWFAQRAPR
jgi:serine/threonine protein kinase/Tfp pilus assembly protein PilF